MTELQEIAETLRRCAEKLEQLVKLTIELDGDTSPPPTKRAAQIPANWQPQEAAIEWAKSCYPNVSVADETDRFRDYWIAAGKPLKSWDAAYRNWIRKAADFAKARPVVLAGRSEARAATIVEGNRERRDGTLDFLSSVRSKTGGREV